MCQQALIQYRADHAEAVKSYQKYNLFIGLATGVLWFGFVAGLALPFVAVPHQLLQPSK